MEWPDKYRDLKKQFDSPESEKWKNNFPMTSDLLQRDPGWPRRFRVVRKLFNVSGKASLNKDIYPLPESAEMIPNVREFYRNRSVLVTGGTGFMGKVLIEKLLYSIPELRKVYVLIRQKKGLSANQRLDNILQQPLFDRIKEHCPYVLAKITPVEGDILADNLGLCNRDFNLLCRDVSVVFHLAASLKLEAPLKENVDMNTGGTFRVLEVAKRLKELILFVHLSTAFCYPDLEVLEERVYSPPVKPHYVMHLTEWLDDKQLATITSSLLGPHPNCYTFSKRLAESLVEEAHKSMPTVIVRPSIVCPAISEPMPGWVDNLNGPVGVMLGAGKGVIRTMLCDGSLDAQVIPVDTAINAIIVIGMLEGIKQITTSEVPVYNADVGHQKPTTWGEVLEIAKEYSHQYPLSWPLWYPNGSITTLRPVHEVRRVLYHLVPAYFIDFLMTLFQQKRFMVRIQKRITQGLELLQYFTMRPWHFSCSNFDKLQLQLNEEDQIVFNMDQTKTNRNLYLQKCIEGGRVYCLKEKPSKIEVNRRYHYFLYIMDWIVKIFFWLLLLSFFSGWCQPLMDYLAIGENTVMVVPFVGPASADGDARH